MVKLEKEAKVQTFDLMGRWIRDHRSGTEK